MSNDHEGTTDSMYEETIVYLAHLMLMLATYICAKLTSSDRFMRLSLLAAIFLSVLHISDMVWGLGHDIQIAIISDYLVMVICTGLLFSYDYNDEFGIIGRKQLYSMLLLVLTVLMLLRIIFQASWMNYVSAVILCVPPAVYLLGVIDELRMVEGRRNRFDLVPYIIVPLALIPGILIDNITAIPTVIVSTTVAITMQFLYGRYKLIVLDPVSGMYNRYFAENRLAYMFREYEGHPDTFAIIFGDMDGFRRIGAEYGTDVTARIIRRIGISVMRIADDRFIPFNYGDDEFIFTVVGDQNAVESRIREIEDIVESIDEDYPDFPVHMSIGYVMQSPDFTDYSEMIIAADAARGKEMLCTVTGKWSYIW